MMDIFTTQLTRVVPVPIKPASLKVKALLKEAATGELKEDHDHVENHEHYFISPDQQKGGEQYKASPQRAKKVKKDLVKDEEDKNESVLVEGKDHKLHLDIYI